MFVLKTARVKAGAEKFEEEPGILTTQYSRLGPKVTKVFPLLNPELSFEEAKEAHLANREPDGIDFFRNFPDHTGNIDQAFLINFVQEFPL